MDIIEKAIPHIFRNKYLKNQGGTIIMGGSGGGFSSSSTGSGASELDDLTDVTVDYIANEDILQFDEVTGQWKNKPLEVDWGRVKNTPTTLEGYGITDAVHKSHLDDNVRHITQAERNTWNTTTDEFNAHNADEVRHITAEEREDWNNPMIKKLKDVKLDEVKDNDILIYRETDNLWHNEQLPEYDWKKILSVNEDGEVVSKFDIIVEGECFIWDEEEDRELTPISDADSYKLITSIGDELRISANLIIVRNISYDKSDSPIIDAEITDYIGITDNGDIIINSLRLVDKNLTVVDPAIQTEKNDYLKDALYFDSAGCLRCKVPFIGDDSISVTGGAHDTLFPGGNSGGGSTSVIDNLDSYDAFSALSANQGRVLNEKIDNYEFADLKNKPTTLAGYGITDSFVSNADLENHIEDTSVHSTEEQRILWDAAANLRHEHYNNIILDNISQEDIDKWNTGGETVEIVDNLTTSDSTKALSANQGCVISNMFDNINFENIKNKPTTVAGYGIIDAVSFDDIKRVTFSFTSDSRFYNLVHIPDKCSLRLTIQTQYSGVQGSTSYIISRDGTAELNVTKFGVDSNVSAIAIRFANLYIQFRDATSITITGEYFEGAKGIDTTPNQYTETQLDSMGVDIYKEINSNIWSNKSIRTENTILSTSIKSDSYTYLNSNGNYVDLISYIQSLEERIAALEGGA